MESRLLMLLTLQLLVLPPALDGSIWSHSYFTDVLVEQPTHVAGPEFDTTVPNNLTGLVGKTAQLHCRVKNLGNRTVSWVRHRDIHLLTVGRYTYTSDQRFEAVHSPLTGDWTLRIRYPQKKDSGVYECQVSTTPPIGHAVQLSIVEPLTEILGGPDLFINTGSTINLTCLVTFAPEPPSGVQWLHNGQVINFDSPRGGVRLVTEKGSITTSRLLIQKAAAEDTGLYTCAPNNVPPDSVRVHVLKGDLPAAMQHSGADGSALHWSLMTSSLLLVPLLHQLLRCAAAERGLCACSAGNQLLSSGDRRMPER
ncbi:zwei Ig domain protein zig-8-like [Schistocerca cancellata]|uniref:zwei Ig domain protein zig-8-like n=1 Tax=Schistocerca cancellata TaxID=274614 RepID=UPI002117DD0A|nr:zwei Ig domain protein zig-8-like [Schistocerca cancellata]